MLSFDIHRIITNLKISHNQGDGENMGLAEKINDKTAKVGIIGLGYVGLPIAVDYAHKGFTVVGIDVDKKKKEKIDRGENYIDDVETEKFTKAVEEKKLTAVTNYDLISELDIIYICVPTPFTANKNPDAQKSDACEYKLFDMLFKKIAAFFTHLRSLSQMPSIWIFLVTIVLPHSQNP